MQFDFGSNWKAFSDHALTREKAENAAADFSALLAGVPLQGTDFLDIGFGQGLSLLHAASRGARAVGCDINPLCAQVLAANRASFFPDLAAGTIPVVTGSILDTGCIDQLRRLSPGGDGRYGLVHSWGVLHHTGDMKTAFSHAASLVRPGGHLVLAIYNRHWSSPAWKCVKWLYCRLPGRGRDAMIRLLYPVIFLAKWLVTGRRPETRQARGMDFYYDVIDWVGGYPYEYASPAQVLSRFEPLGFRLVKSVPPVVPTGCHEYVFTLPPA